jgi:hypothetical protein
VTDGNGAAVDIELGLVDAEFARTRHHLRAKGLVDLEAIDILKLQSCAFEHGSDRRHRADTHDVRRHAHGGAGDDARERGRAGGLRVIGGGDERGGRAVDDGRGIAAGLHPAEGGADRGERFQRGGAHMGVGGKLVHALKFQRAWLKALPLEPLTLDRRDLAGEEAGLLRRERAFEASRGVGVDLAPRNLVGPREVLGRVAHGDVGGRIAQRFPQKILEIDRTHAKSAHGIGSNRVAAHGFGADAQREPDCFVCDNVSGLHQHFDAGAANALHHVRRHLDRHPGIEPDMARQAVGIEARLRHRAGDDGADILRRHARTRKGGARGLDAEIGRRDLRQRAVVVGEWRAHAIEEPHLAPTRREPGCLASHDHALLSITSTRDDGSGA